MTINFGSSVTGAAQTGFTSPTYTLVADTSPDNNARQSAVSALGGTQAGVTIHSVSSPFTISAWRPKQFQQLGKPNPTTGLISRVPMNTFKVITRKGVTPLAGQPVKPMVVNTTMDIPAGADLADPANVRAALSLHFGALWAAASGIGDTTISGTL